MECLKGMPFPQPLRSNFSTKGFREASMNEFSIMTGVARGTLFYHFKNKEGLFLAGALYGELIASCRRILKNGKG